MNKNKVIQEIKECTTEELHQWKEHAIKCLQYYLKYRNEFEIRECQFIIDHIEEQLKTNH